MRKGRKPITGRYDTREELEEAVLRDYYNTSRNMTQVARACRVSQSTVSAILNKHLPRTTIHRAKEQDA